MKPGKPVGQAVMKDADILRINPVVEWLLNEGWTASDSTTLIEGLADRLVAQGFPLSRLLVFIRSLQPRAVGTRYTWHRDNGYAESWPAPYSVVETGMFRDSPVFAIIEGAEAVIRRRLDIPNPRLDYPILKDLLAAGATDYVAMPLVFSEGQINVITFVADRPGGFTDFELVETRNLVRVLARLLEIHAVRRTAKTLLDTYLGKHTGERVLRGLIKRGDGEDIHAVIWFCDLRDSTLMAESMPRMEFLGVLNDFFDCMAGAVLDQGGEVLRFIGDATLAIFATGKSSSGVDRGCCDTVSACHAALAAAKDAQVRMGILNRNRARIGEPPLRSGLALHMGDVTYGNIGVPERLEFTVIGAAANEAARLEGLCKTLDQPLLISSAFKRCFPAGLVSLGFHTLRGVSVATEVFTLPKDAA
ncbi:adenylate/guanylate cyclase domain-containing protein [Gammaproteobacteria bacterium]|nr:adenylate/guanylate cyclase domain-containing protein [Gammaproteobacteria bacterium]